MPQAITLTEILMWLLCMRIPQLLFVVANSSNSFWYCVEGGSRSIHSSVWTACCVLVCWYWRTLMPLQLIRGCDSDLCRCLSSCCSWSRGDCRMRRICSYYILAVHDVMMWCCGFEQSEWTWWIQIRNYMIISFISLQAMEDDGFAQSRLFLRKRCLLDEEKLD